MLAGIFTLLFLSVITLLLSKASFIQTAIDAFSTRFDNANKTEGGLEGVIMDRYLGGLIGALSTADEKPFFGIGIGAGTNVGSSLLIGKRQFLAGEQEWYRLVAELGPIFGILVILIRMTLTYDFIRRSLLSLKKNHILPWLLLSFGLLTTLQAGWAQPTSLGFSVLIGGLFLASLEKPKSAIKYVLKRKQMARTPLAIKQAGH